MVVVSKTLGSKTLGRICGLWSCWLLGFLHVPVYLLCRVCASCFVLGGVCYAALAMALLLLSAEQAVSGRDCRMPVVCTVQDVNLEGPLAPLDDCEDGWRCITSPRKVWTNRNPPALRLTLQCWRQWVNVWVTGPDWRLASAKRCQRQVGTVGRVSPTLV